MADSSSKGFFSGFNFGDVLGGITGIGSIIGNAISTKKTNQMNYKIAQMNNEFNERMMDKQLSWNEDMWNKQNAYNTPLAQRGRLKAAGINPYLMLGGNAGVASAVNSGSAASASGNPVMQSWNPSSANSLASAFSGMADRIYNKELMRESINSLRLDNDFKDHTMMNRILQTWQDLQGSRYRNYYQSKVNEFFDKAFDSNLQALKERNSREALITSEQMLTNAMLNISYSQADNWNRNFSSQSQAFQFLSQVWAAYNLSDTNKEIKARVANIYEDTFGKRMNNEFFRDTMDNLKRVTNARNLFDAGLFEGLDSKVFAESANLEKQSVTDYLKNFPADERARLEKARMIMENNGIRIRNARDLIQGLNDAKHLIFGDAEVNAGFSFGPFQIGLKKSM